MEKIFLGECLASELNEFAKDGEVITLWRLTLALNEEKCVTFNISKQSNPELFNRVQDVIPGMTIKAFAVGKGSFDGRIKWQLTDVAYTDVNSVDVHAE